MIEIDRFVAPEVTVEDVAQEDTIRPARLADYIGQPKVRDQMSIFMQAAQQRREPLDHTLVFGPPGLGKTTLAMIIAAEMKGQLHSTSGPVLEKPGDLAAIMTNLEEAMCCLSMKSIV